MALAIRYSAQAATQAVRADTAANFVADFKAGALAGGWTATAYASGTKDGWYLNSADGQARLLLYKDSASPTYVWFQAQSQDGLLVSAQLGRYYADGHWGGYKLHAFTSGLWWYVLGTSLQMSHGYIFLPWRPDFISAIYTRVICWGFDCDPANVNNPWRTFRYNLTGASATNCGTIINNAIFAGAFTHCVLQAGVKYTDNNTTLAQGAKWANGNAMACEPWMMSALAAPGGERMIVGQIEDAMYVNASLPLDQTAVFDGRNWRNYTQDDKSALLLREA